MNKAIEMRNVSAAYGDNEVLRQISLAVDMGEFLVVIGPSGCGKTTLLKLINGLVVPTKGEVFVAGERLSDCDLTALRRKIGYAVQGAKLFPHLTVEDNICYVPCLERKMTKEEKQALTEKMLAMTELSPELASRFPSQLSGGQKQRWELPELWQPNRIFCLWTSLLEQWMRSRAGRCRRNFLYYRRKRESPLCLLHMI